MTSNEKLDLIEFAVLSAPAGYEQDEQDIQFAKDHVGTMRGLVFSWSGMGRVRIDCDNESVIYEPDDPWEPVGPSQEVREFIKELEDYLNL